ncbi:MAG: DUF3152 domain-containing protein [Pseudonocardiaceae bacterium]|nr:DUF3152 domain-containing protein [Pseudonocardiaceae bacterium]
MPTDSGDCTGSDRLWHPVAVTRPTQGDRSAASPTAQSPRGATRLDEAEPLTASWDPVPQDHGGASSEFGAIPGTAPRRRRRRPRRLARLVSTYGWRVYALPVLVVLTALAVVDSARSPSPPTPPTSPPAGSALSEEAPAAPLIDNPSTGQGFAAGKAAAELPGGGPFSTRGAGTWSVVPGTSPQFGTGRLFTYTVEVEDGVELPGGGEGFATTTDATLNNPKSWIGSKEYAFRRVDDPAAADVRISLTSQRSTRKICGFVIPYDGSCWRGDMERVVLNTARWTRGAVAFQGNVVQYQQYVVNHEVGHALGFSHVGCERNGALAPIMMQQTWGVANDYIAELGSDGVTGDGKVCEPNAWPFPVVN